jgi:hypothetical protein
MKILRSQVQILNKNPNGGIVNLFLLKLIFLLQIFNQIPRTPNFLSLNFLRIFLIKMYPPMFLQSPMFFAGKLTIFALKNIFSEMLFKMLFQQAILGEFFVTIEWTRKRFVARMLSVVLS